MALRLGLATFLCLVSGMVLEVSTKSKEKKLQLCPGVPTCECKPVQKAMDISCWDVHNLTDVRGLLSKSLKTAINKLVLKDCSVRVIPSNFVVNSRSILQFVSYCPLERIEENAFANARRLHQVIIRNSNFTEIPKGLQVIPKNKVLSIIGGSLKKLDKELQKLNELNHLTLRKTALVNISARAFENNPMMMVLDLSQNYLTFIHEGTLDHLKKLGKVILSQNKLLTLENVFKMVQPQVVDVSENELATISDAFPETITGMENLKLRNNPLEPEDLLYLSKKLSDRISVDVSECNLTRLDELVSQHSLFDAIQASHNMLTDIPTEEFHRMQQIRRVDLSYNKLTSIGDIFAGKEQLFSLNLDENNISSLDISFANIPHLKQISLSGNKIQFLNKGTFSGTSALRSVNISSNLVSSLDEDIFVNQRNIDVLDLSRNKFPSLNGSLKKLSRLRTVKLDGGFLEFIDGNDLPGMHSLQTLSLRGNRLRRVDGAFHSHLSLRYLDLAGNRLKTLPRNCFPENMKITQLWLAEGNEWECDCRLLWLLEWNQRQQVKDDPTCHYPSRLHDVPLRNLTARDLTDGIEDCPEYCNCRCRSEARDYVTEVDCSNKDLDTIPDVLPVHTGALKMHNNSQTVLDFGNFSNLKDMRILDFSNNHIENISGQLPLGLKFLHLNDNKLKRLPETLENVGHLHQLTLSSNPWLCDCATVRLRKWLITFIDKIIDAHAVLCDEDFQNGILVGRQIAATTDEELCPPNKPGPNKRPGPSLATVIGSISSLVFVTVLSALVCFHYKTTINAWLYSRGLMFLKSDEDGTDKVFDALLLYSAEDQEFAIKNIATRLEKQKPRYRIYLALRETLDGLDVATNMTAVLNNCKRVIVILSQAFLEDGFCMETIRSAFTLCQSQNTNRVIIIKYKDTPAKSDINCSLKEKIESNFILHWQDRMFWPKLRYLMPKK